MKKYLFLFVATTIFPIASIFAQCAQTANIYSFSYGGHNYQIVKELKSWTDAAACAVERGGYLVRIDNSAENAQLITAITSAGISSSYHPVDDGGGASYIWTGGTDKNTEGNWLWDGDNNNVGTNFYSGQGTAGTGGGAAVGGSYINWGCSTLCEPDNYFYLHDQDALGLAISSWPYGAASQWNDIDINNTLYYIIEIENTGIKDTKGSLNFDIYPNPATDFIQINGLLPNKDNLEICIISTEGKSLLNQKYTNRRIDISAFSNGIYFIKIQSENENFMSRLVKQ
ncbi:MAG: T9SS type A sorting domain-containing protein [Bacteroidales bacterium]